jgi:hypothetical protein
MYSVPREAAPRPIPQPVQRPSTSAYGNAAAYGNAYTSPCTQFAETNPKKIVPEFLKPEVVQARREALGYNEPAIADFTDDCEFLSLGCFCGVAQALRSVDLHKHSYPLDWVRSDVSGVIHCLDYDFEDFFDYSYTFKDERSGFHVHADTPWGGSFWHHDPNDAKTRSDFDRRIQRFQGLLPEVPKRKTRVFCIALNALSDLELIPSLRAKLEWRFPKAEIYLIVFIDNQPRARIYHVEDDEHTAFVLTPSDIFENNGAKWTEPAQAQMYAAGIVTVLRFWAGVNNSIREISDIDELLRVCAPFECPSPGAEMFWPFRTSGRPDPLRRRGKGDDAGSVYSSDVSTNDSESMFSALGANGRLCNVMCGMGLNDTGLHDDDFIEGLQVGSHPWVEPRTLNGYLPAPNHQVRV